MDAIQNRPPPLEGADYLNKLLKYLAANKARLALPPFAQPSPSAPGNLWQQSYTLLTLGLDPNSSPLSWDLAVPLTLGFGGKAVHDEQRKNKQAAPPSSTLKPLTLRLPPDRLLYLLLLFQSSPTPSLSSSPNIGRTDVPVPSGVHLVPSGGNDAGSQREGDVKSVRSWVGSLRSVGLGSMFGTSSGTKKTSSGGGWGWLGGKKEIMDEDAKLRKIYGAFTILPSLIIHPPSPSDPLIKDLVDENAYTSLGGIDIRVPLSVFRGLWSLELDGYDPRGLLIPSHPALKSLMVRNVENGDDWLDELLGISEDEQENRASAQAHAKEVQDPGERAPRFPSLRHLALTSTSLFSLPELPCPMLTHLDLSNNLLNAIPSSLSSLHTLQTLNLSNNMIESVRGANLVLGQLHVLNLRNNRIDCLSGLERVLGLERLDLRKNQLSESAEVGRLAVLPLIKEIWIGSGNHFVEREEDWRVSVLVTFAEEGREDVVLDGYPASWSETRAVQAEVKRRGRRARGQPTQQHQHRHRAELAESVRSPTVSQAQQRSTNGTKSTANGQTQSASDPAAGPASTGSPTESRSTQTPSRAPPQRQAKRRRQRIVDLDGTVRYQLAGSESEEGSTPRSSEEVFRQPVPTASGPADDNLVSRAALPSVTSSGRAQAVKKTSRQSRVVASSHEPASNSSGPAGPSRRAASQDDASAIEAGLTASASDATEPSGDDLRARMEALKMEVGDSWLKVLAGQAKTQAEPMRGDGISRESNRTTGAAGPEASASAPAVQVVKKVKKKKSRAAVGKIS